MNNERYMKHYVDVVNSTLTESVLRNVSLQANANFVDELVGELNSENESLKKQIQEIGKKSESKAAVPKAITELEYKKVKCENEICRIMNNLSESVESPKIIIPEKPKIITETTQQIITPENCMCEGYNKLYKLSNNDFWKKI